VEKMKKESDKQKAKGASISAQNKQKI